MIDENDITFNQYGLDVEGVLSGVLSLLNKILGGGGDGNGGGFLSNLSVDSIVSFFTTVWNVITIVGLLLGALFLFGFIYASIRFNQTAELEAERVKKQEELWQQLYGRGAKRQSRIADIEEHINSNNPNDWKLAIIEADIELGKVLDKAGYIGSSIGEQLKSASSHAFKTIDDAWEAHKVRNQIAHEGADFVLTYRNARDTIQRYKRVFEEFEG